MAHIRQSRPDSGLGFQVDILRCSLFARQRLQLLHRNVQRFRGGLVFKAHRLLYHSVITKKGYRGRVGRLEGDPEVAAGPVEPLFFIVLQHERDRLRECSI